tara:strand:- start:1151 stop:1558 length:408 start_codon:yes stop_codon:yes gene_type:complete
MVSDSAENINRGVFGEELVICKLLEEGFNVARPVKIGPVDLLSIWAGKAIKRLQIKSVSNRTAGRLRYEFKIASKTMSVPYSDDLVDYFILCGVETKSFWVVPKKATKDITKVNCTIGGNGQYDKFFDAFSLLKK